MFDRYRVFTRVTAAVSDVRNAGRREFWREGGAARAQLKGKRLTLVKDKRRRTAEDEVEIRCYERQASKSVELGDPLSVCAHASRTADDALPVRHTEVRTAPVHECPD